MATVAAYEHGQHKKKFNEAQKKLIDKGGNSNEKCD
jgi:hypothetical protein